MYELSSHVLTLSMCDFVSFQNVSGSVTVHTHTPSRDRDGFEGVASLLSHNSHKVRMATFAILGDPLSICEYPFEFCFTNSSTSSGRSLSTSGEGLGSSGSYSTSQRSNVVKKTPNILAAIREFTTSSSPTSSSQSKMEAASKLGKGGGGGAGGAQGTQELWHMRNDLVKILSSTVHKINFNYVEYQIREIMHFNLCLPLCA